MKMRGLIRSGVLAATAAGFLALAGTPAAADPDVGCGVGTNIWKGQSGLFPKLCASFTNGLLFQSVSITFGVMGCDGRGTVTVGDAQLRRFAATNLDGLARDVSRGDGERLDAFAQLLGVPAEERPAFFAFTQAHFVELFPSAATESNEMVDAFYRIVGDHAIES